MSQPKEMPVSDDMENRNMVSQYQTEAKGHISSETTSNVISEVANGDDTVSVGRLDGVKRECSLDLCTSKLQGPVLNEVQSVPTSSVKLCDSSTTINAFSGSNEPVNLASSLHQTFSSNQTTRKKVPFLLPKISAIPDMLLLPAGQYQSKAVTVKQSTENDLQFDNSNYAPLHYENRGGFNRPLEITANVGNTPLRLSNKSSSKSMDGVANCLKVNSISIPVFSICNLSPATPPQTELQASLGYDQDPTSKFKSARSRTKGCPKKRKIYEVKVENEVAATPNVTDTASHTHNYVPHQNMDRMPGTALFPISNMSRPTEIPVQFQLPWWSQYCGGVLDKNSELNFQTQVNDGTGNPYKCEICGSGFASRTALTLTPEQSYACTNCAALRNQILQQSMVHKEAIYLPYKCTECEASFKNKRSLAHHSRVHVGAKPFNCQECGATFARKGHLMTHTLLHTGEKPYKCKDCDAVFTHKTSLKDHTLQHSGEKPYKCLECGSAFGRKGHLNTHSLIHSGKTPYQCIICGNSFTHKTSLQDHMLQHTGEKPHKCEECGAAFTRKGHLNTHAVIHTRKRLFQEIQPNIDKKEPPLPVNVLSEMLSNPNPAPNPVHLNPIVFNPMRPLLPSGGDNMSCGPNLPSHPLTLNESPPGDQVANPIALNPQMSDNISSVSFTSLPLDYQTSRSEDVSTSHPPHVTPSFVSPPFDIKAEAQSMP